MLDNYKLLRQVVDMRNDIKNDLILSKEEYSTKYNYLYTHSPTLFEIVYSDEKPYLEQLDDMMRMFTDVKTEKITQEDAKKKLVENLNKKYIDTIPGIKKNQE
jgi:hypothetical protein